MDDGSLSELLGRLGLSEKEIDTYLTLLEHGEAKASDVADDAGVSKRYVYSISEKLEERGFVEVNDHVVPTTIRANPPGEVVETLTDQVESMQPALEERYSAAAPESEQFEVIKARVTVLKRISERIATADEEVTLSIPAAHLDEVADALRAAVERGATALLVVTNVEDPESYDFDGLAHAVRAWREPMPTMLTVDRRSGLVAPAEMVARSNSGKRAIAFTQQQLAPVIVGSFFGNYWPMADEVFVADPEPLPATYTDFRAAILQSALHLRQETEIVARVAGSWVGDGSDVTLTGAVTGVRQGLVEPRNNTFPVENSLLVDVDGETVSVGGKGAFVEDVEAERVTLEPAE
ncbi:TrmB family transcriptional regulator [Halobaculum sp. D14]|uniref:TrmB family transcriptional regulator n=1 Tax=unclassified Halobaculum TaxID=2640896 RepID=UPI003EB7B802